MNQKDYKAIAEIIKTRIIAYSDYSLGKRLLNGLARELGFYFEESEQLEIEEGGILDFHKFNRKQFLKDCGVEE